VAEDRSDASFTIRPVMITWPLNGAIVTSGTTEYISWGMIGDVGPVEDAMIYYSKSGGTGWSLIATVPENPGGCSWPVPFTKMSKGKCKIKVVLRDSRKKIVATDISEGYFAMAPAP
jgi:hypothetical protein